MTWFHRYEKFREQGICYQCKGKSRPGMVLCQKCADKKAESDKRRREGKSKPFARQYAGNLKWKTGTDLRSVRRRQGLCVKCGHKAPKNRAMCDRCRIRKNAQSRALCQARLAAGKPYRPHSETRDHYAETARPRDRIADEMHAIAVKLAAGKLPW